MDKYIYAAYSYGITCDVVANESLCEIAISKFELQSGYYVNFQTNTLVKYMIPPFSSTLNTVFLHGFSIK